MKHLILSIALITTLISFSQDFIKQSVNIKQDGLSYKFYVLDSDEKGVRNYDNEKYYYWFKTQKVISTQGGSSGSLLNGIFQSFYANNQLYEQGNFDKGLKVGEWKKWDNRGTLVRIENWRNGKLSGKQSDFNGNGELTSLTIIKRRITIIEKVDTVITLRGKHVKTVYLDTTGNKVSVSRTTNGLLHGKQESFNAEGKWIYVDYKKGELKVKKEKKTSSTNTSSSATDSSEKESIFKRIFKKKNKSTSSKTDKSETSTNNEKKEPKEKKTKKVKTQKTTE